MIKAGARSVTASRNGTKMWSARRGSHNLSGALWCIGTYVAKSRQLDGVLTWRLESREGSYSVKATAEREAGDYATAAGLPFECDIKHGVRVNPAPPAAPEVVAPVVLPPSEDIHDWCYGEAA